MVNFLIITSKITPFSKKDVDEGNTPPDIYKLCVGIREAFCVSYNIRKDNNLYFYIEKSHKLIKFIGDELRYLGSDERSQALLFNKVLSFNHPADNNWTQSTPGIYVRTFKNNQEFTDFLIGDEKELVFILENTTPLSLPFLYHLQGYPKIKKIHQIKELNKKHLIIPAKPLDNKILIDILKIITENHTSELKSIKLTSLSKVNSLGDKVLYVNFQIDQQGMIKK